MTRRQLPQVIDLTQDDDDSELGYTFTPRRRRRVQTRVELDGEPPPTRPRRQATTTWDQILAPLANVRSSSPPPPGPPIRTSPAARAAVRRLIRANHADKASGVSRRHSEGGGRRTLNNVARRRSMDDGAGGVPVVETPSTLPTRPRPGASTVIPTSQRVHNPARRALPSPIALPRTRPSQDAIAAQMGYGNAANSNNGEAEQCECIDLDSSD